MLSYSNFAERLLDTCIISDPWIEGRERFRIAPVVLDAELYDRLTAAAEAIAAVFQELSALVIENPQLLDDYFGLTLWQKYMWLASGGNWHGIARLDMFELEDGSVATCEMNSDTPSGEAETVLLNELLHPFSPGVDNPNKRFEELFTGMVMAMYRARAAQPREAPVVGVIYPTDMPEDLSMVALYTRWFERRGCKVICGSPLNVRHAEGGVGMFGQRIDIILRHYKTDWWGEREQYWFDAEPYPDPDPLADELRLLLNAESRGHVVVVNPFGAVVTQSKLALAFCHDYIESFSSASQEVILRHIPETRRLAECEATALEREQWVLKPDYGCEGDDVIVGPFVDDTVWQESLRQAIPRRWVAQRFFRAKPVEGFLPNYGVYIVGGVTAGIFTRLSPQSTDYTALSAPTFICRSTHNGKKEA